MQTALQTLVSTAPVCRPLKADLQRSTITLDWPANVLVQRTDYVLVPKVEVEAAVATDGEMVVFPSASVPGRYRSSSDDLDFSFTRGGRRWNLYFNRIPEGNYPKAPGTWWGSMDMQDIDGREWSSVLPRMVTNDFGDLVDLKTGERP
jgi:hypothetical protein